ncbi:hypothetical protein HWV62_23627 [Athelia sp. TMB]|nr:hypothetical protein HWV62_23627 [Athelia sp. TMB]
MDPFHAKLVAAATGSTLTALTMTPFDVVKTRLQTQPPKPLFKQPPRNACCQPTSVPCVRNMSSLARSAASLHSQNVVCIWENGVFRAERVNGFADAVRHVWRAEGVRGLWKGAGTSLVMGVPASTCYMLTYDHLLRNVLPSIIPYESLVPMTAGILARTSITTLVSPLELVRTNLQSTPKSWDNPHTLRSVLASVRVLVREQGVRSLWRGLGPSLWRDVPFSGLYWASYESWKSFFQRRGQSGAWIAFICGATSGISAALVTSPFDVLKTRRQASVMNSTPASMKAASQTIPLILKIIKNEGPSALFAGLLPRIAKIAPACGIMIASFEGVGKALEKKL